MYGIRMRIRVKSHPRTKVLGNYHEGNYQLSVKVRVRVRVRVRVNVKFKVRISVKFRVSLSVRVISWT